MNRIALALTALLLIPSPGAAQDETRGKKPTPSPVPPSVASHPPRGPIRVVGQVWVGELAPDFTLDGSGGQPVKLSTLRGDWILLAFDDRKEKLAELRAAVDTLRQIGMHVVAVCPEKAHTLMGFAQREGLPFLMLSDVTGDISGLYGLRDLEQSETRPGYIIIDRRGVVRTALLGQSLPVEDVARIARYAVRGF